MWIIQIKLEECQMVLIIISFSTIGNDNKEYDLNDQLNHIMILIFRLCVDKTNNFSLEAKVWATLGKIKKKKKRFIYEKTYKRMRAFQKSRVISSLIPNSTNRILKYRKILLLNYNMWLFISVFFKGMISILIIVIYFQVC